MFKKLNKKGFTLAELLVVVAIIGVLVAISIPIFTSQLEKAREATDAANLRAAYATASAQVLETEKGASAGPVAMHQATGGFATDVKNSSIGGVALSGISADSAVSGKSLYVNVSTDGKVTITESASFTKVDPITGEVETTAVAGH